MSLHVKEGISLQSSQVENVGNLPVLTTRPVDSVNINVRGKTRLGPLLFSALMLMNGIQK